MRYMTGLCVFFGTLVLACEETSGQSAECASATQSVEHINIEGLNAEMVDVLQEIVKCLPSEEAAQEHAENIGANAAVGIQLILKDLYLNTPPDLATLRTLGAENLNIVLHPRRDVFTHSTLLTEAVRQANYAWTMALLQSGADPNGSGSLMAYVAVTEIWDPRSKWTALFQDGAPAIPFLQAYLDFGGYLNTTQDGGYGNAPLIRSPVGNLAATVFLLEQGADPWLTENPPRRLNFNSTMMGRYIFGSLAADFNEIMYVLVTRGLYTPPPQPVYQPLVHDFYLESLEELSDASGPERRHKLWTLQKVVSAMIARNAFEPSQRMLELLASNPIPDDEGGWVLPEGQLHQDYDDARVGATLGSNVW
ncbi:hypothetical protein FHS72_003535 [Loktanella ponticola]|uniref:Ankyrin repeat domain-containing protein n=1 Tax=Yoonia ponticola TaxID=1524255 RepID=A0A7W9BNS4_9RHOB|nr:hypothetical protein [Yoonia ponticola]MBB5723888.1 hypothetical protein [Yoonia ponticola]